MLSPLVSLLFCPVFAVEYFLFQIGRIRTYGLKSFVNQTIDTGGNPTVPHYEKTSFQWWCFVIQVHTR